jgi:hypothetical protein
MPKYPTSNAESGQSRQHAGHSSPNFNFSSPTVNHSNTALARGRDATFQETKQSEGNDVTEPLTGKRTPFITCTRPQYAVAVAVMQLLTSELWIETLKPFGGLRSRCCALETLDIHSDAALLAALHEQLRPDVVTTRDDQSAWTAALKQCARVAFEKLLEASKQGWLAPMAFDRDGNTVLHIAMRCWDSRALLFLEGQVRSVWCMRSDFVCANWTFAVQCYTQQCNGNDKCQWLYSSSVCSSQLLATCSCSMSVQQIMRRNGSGPFWANKRVHKLLLLCSENV